MPSPHELNRALACEGLFGRTEAEQRPVGHRWVPSSNVVYIEVRCFGILGGLVGNVCLCLKINIAII